MITSDVYKQFLNLVEGTVVVNGIPVYRDGVLKFNKKNYELMRDDMEVLVEKGMFEEVDGDYEPAPFVPERSPDILSLEEDYDDENIFVEDKGSNIFGNRNPRPRPAEAKDVASDVDIIDAKAEAVKKEAQSPRAKVKKSAAAQKEKSKAVDFESDNGEEIPPTDIDDRIVGLQDKEPMVDDGFEGSQRKISCVSGVDNWYEAAKMIKEINDLTELDIIIKNDTRNGVVSAAEKRREKLLEKKSPKIKNKKTKDDE